jgi:hypothetical protein
LFRRRSSLKKLSTTVPGTHSTLFLPPLLFGKLISPSALRQGDQRILLSFPNLFSLTDERNDGNFFSLETRKVFGWKILSSIVGGVRGLSHVHVCVGKVGRN